MRDEQRQWLAGHGITLRGEAARRFAAAWADISSRYGDERIREAAILAAAQHLSNGSDLDAVGRALARARRHAETQLAVARTVALLAIEDGKSEASTAREIGVDRMAVREWQGKR